MTKTLIVAALLTSFAAVTFAQATTPSADGASAPTKQVKGKVKVKKARHPASAAVNPETSPDKKGGN